MKSFDEVFTSLNPILQQGWAMSLDSPWAAWDTWTCYLRKLDTHAERYPQLRDDSETIRGEGNTAGEAMAECLEAWREEYKPEDGREVK